MCIRDRTSAAVTICLQCEFKMVVSIQKPGKCEVHTVIHFAMQKEKPLLKFVAQLSLFMVKLLSAGETWQNVLTNFIK